MKKIVKIYLSVVVTVVILMAISLLVFATLFSGMFQSIMIPNPTETLLCDYSSNHDLSCNQDASLVGGLDYSNKINFAFNDIANLKRGILQPVLKLDDSTARQFFSRYTKCSYELYPYIYYASDGLGTDYSNSILKANYVEDVECSATKLSNGSYLRKCIPNDDAQTRSCGTNMYYKINIVQVLKDNYDNSLLTISSNYGTFYGLCSFTNQNCPVDFSALLKNDTSGNDVKLQIYNRKLTLGKDATIPEPIVISTLNPSVITVPVVTEPNTTTNNAQPVSAIVVPDSSVVTENPIDNTITITSPNSVVQTVSSDNQVTTTSGTVLWTPKAPTSYLWFIFGIVGLIVLLLVIFIVIIVKSKK